MLQSASGASFISKITPFLHSQHKLCNFSIKILNSHLRTRPFTSFSKNTPSLIDSQRKDSIFITPSSLSMDAVTSAEVQSAISLQEWQGWGTTSPVPAMVNQIIHDMKLLEKDIDVPMIFGGNRGALKGGFKVEEEKKHRAKYASLDSPEEKLQFFSARQIACRLLGSRGYLCQKCWLPMEDCLCSRVTACSLWHRLRIWLYMHPKDFLRQNNTGKLLWQVFGVEAASLCLFGIAEHEEMMWNELNHAGRNRVWCVYPNKNAMTESVTDIAGCFVNPEIREEPVNEDDTIHFILIDGTWSNSAAMFRRLQARAEIDRGEELRCISLNTGASLMHKLRPQPSWDRTCTAAAAIGLLYELSQLPELSSLGLDEQAEAIDNALEVLFEGLVARRLRRGRSISRKERHNWDIW